MIALLFQCMHNLTTKRLVSAPFLLLLLAGSPVMKAAEPDLKNGEEINELCAGCHGEYGQGGKQGEYPRIAGQPEQFIIKQMHLFRDRKRPNIPMLEYVDERQFPDQEIIDIAAYVSRIELPTKLPPLVEGAEFNAHERLQLTKKLLNIARVEGNVDAGRKTYNKECRSCHGDGGWGKKEKGVPMLAGQYTEYLKRQATKYLKKIRIHDEDDPDDELLAEFSEDELQNIYAYLSIVDDE
jgi:cytochrome c553